jgi:thioredoxin reductase
MSEHNCDVIIIGGGLAGLFAGIACVRNELPTLVLENRHIKSIKPVVKVLCPRVLIISGSWE